MASADLKGLGATDGPGVVYSWKLANPLPRLLPWLMVLALCGLRPNRTPRAWWVWLPLIAYFALEALCRPALSSIPSQPLDLICQCAMALAFGTAALWLTLPLLNSTHRFVAFLKGLLALALAAGFAFVTSQDWSELGSESFAGLVLLGLLTLTSSVALALAGWNCRRRYAPVRLILWLLGWLLVVFSPFGLLGVLLNGTGVLLQIGFGLLMGVALNLVVVLPFLLLSFVCSFYRDRLKQYLQMEVPVPPPVTPPPPVTTFSP